MANKEIIRNFHFKYGRSIRCLAKDFNEGMKVCRNIRIKEETFIRRNGEKKEETFK